MDLHTSIEEAGKLFKTYASRLKKLEIHTLGDLLTHFPFRYDNFSLISPIAHAQVGEVITIIGTVSEIKNSYLKNHRTLQKAKITDDTGTIDVTWFNQPFIAKTIAEGSKIAVSGRINDFHGKKTMESPEYEIVPSDETLIHTGRLVPVYPETRGVSSKWLRRQVYKLLNSSSFSSDHLPDELKKSYDLMSLEEATTQIHFPQSYEKVQKARERIGFDELFIMQLTALIRRQEWNKKLTGFSFSLEKIKKNSSTFFSALPFELTSAQKDAIENIFNDLAQEKPMNRLLEGDVGSGKTVVSAAAIYATHLNGFQSVLMAPTEILAGQHFKTISTLLNPFGIKTVLITGSQFQISNVKSQINTNKKPKNWKLDIGNLEFDILIGTHAVLSEKVEFKKLGLVVIDEQQRFGVKQRGSIKLKGNNPHLLTMTATPIPRTIALTRFGDLDVSYLHEMPTGRKRIKTWLVPKEKREAGYEWIQKQIKETDSQAFIICPFIEDSENMTTVKAATTEFERLKKDVFPHLKLGLLHGKLKGKEKDVVLQDFKNRKYDILVATPVVEVGIDIPNATIIVIEAAERFGLSQLHQLRGRVGRGDKQSYCLLFTESLNPQTQERLKAMETTHAGSQLAELDLKLRGPGELYGTMQHGVRSLKVAKFSDFDLIQKARSAAQQIIKKLDEYPLLKDKLQISSIKEISRD